MELNAEVRAELEHIARRGPAPLARRARIILSRADGAHPAAIATTVGVHRDSVRRWLIRFRERGLAGLQHGNAGKPKNVVFGAAVRSEICRRARMSPLALGEPFKTWSLGRLREHLIRHGIVRSISVESLRQYLRASSSRQKHWNRPRQTVGPLPPMLRQQLEMLTRVAPPRAARRARALLALAEGSSIVQTAARLRVSESNVRRWRNQFRRAGVSALIDGAARTTRRVSAMSTAPRAASSRRE